MKRELVVSSRSSCPKMERTVLVIQAEAKFSETLPERIHVKRGHVLAKRSGRTLLQTYKGSSCTGLREREREREREEP